jgi:transcriptional regulator with XRE-family HTH domain
MRCDYGIDIGRRIKDAREERRLTQGELGRQLGVPFQMVQRWERGDLGSIRSPAASLPGTVRNFVAIG